MKYKIQLLLGLFVWGLVSTVSSQSDKALLRDLAGENKKSVEALALYPEDVRLAILESCKYPELLIKMNSIREKTGTAFRSLLEDYPRATQETMYELTRFPGLIEKIVEQQESPSAVRKLLMQLPEKERDGAFDVVEAQMRTLQKINELDHTARNATEDLMTTYPAPAQAAFRKLVDLPEVLELLNQDLRFTVLVGDVYREDPAWAIHKTDSLHLAVAREHAQELEDWKKEIADDPQAQKELEAASREYATENGYDSQDYPYDDLYDEGDIATPVRSNYYYPWWFGYPWWYPEPCWQPYPYWYDWGFYYRSHTIVVVYLPSWYFMNWYFYHPRHHYQYNHLSTRFVDHYYGHRRSGTSITMGVGEWRDRNRDVISDEWLKDKGRLPERLKEYGRFEENREAFNARNPKNPLTREQFLDRNTRQYPELTNGRASVKTERQREQESGQIERSKWAPAKEPVKPEPARVPQNKPAQREPAEKSQRPATERPSAEPRKERPIEEAKDYHRNKWEEGNRTTPQRDQAPKTRPEPKTQPAPRTQPTKPPAQKDAKPRSKSSGN